MSALPLRHPGPPPLLDDWSDVGWFESGAVTPVLDRTCTLAETPDAMTYLETARARGKVVITV